MGVGPIPPNDAYSAAESNSRFVSQLSVSALAAAADPATVINAALALNPTNLIIPPGSYTCLTAITPGDDVTVHAYGVTTVNHMPGDNDRLWSLSGCHNVTIKGLVVDGDKAAHAADTEQRHGIFIASACSNVKLIDVRSDNNKGDGIYVSGASTDVSATNVTTDANHRNGLSLVAVTGWKATNCRFINSSGTNPQSGVDIEPNYDTEVIDVIEFIGCTIAGNANNGLNVALRSAPSVKQGNISLVATNVDGNGHHGVCLRGTLDFSMTGGSACDNDERGVTTEAYTNTNITLTGVAVKRNGSSGVDLDAAFKNFNLVGCDVADNGTGGTGFGIDAQPVAASSGLNLIGVRVTGTAQQYGLKTGSNVSKLSIVGGDLTGNGTGDVLLADDLASRLDLRSQPETRVWIPATAGCAGAGSPVIASAGFTRFPVALLDGSSNESWLWQWAVPSSWLSFAVDLYWINTAASSGDVQFAATHNEWSNGGNVTTGETAETTVTTAATANTTTMKVSTVVPTRTVSGLGTGALRISRRGGDAGDTLNAVDVGMVGLMFRRLT